MNEYNHPLLKEVDLSNCANPAQEMLIELWGKRLDVAENIFQKFLAPEERVQGFDLAACLENPLPLFGLCGLQAEFNSDQADCPVCLVYQGEAMTPHPAGESGKICFKPKDTGTEDWRQSSFEFVVPVAVDRKNRLLGGYWVFNGFEKPEIIFDHKAWQEMGQPTDGRGLHVPASVLEVTDAIPFVLSADGLILGGAKGNPGIPSGTNHLPAIGFPGAEVLKKLTADFHLENWSRMTIEKNISYFEMVVIQAIRALPGYASFSWEDLQTRLQACKQAAVDSNGPELVDVSSHFPIPMYAYLEYNEFDSEVFLWAVVPGRGLIGEPGSEEDQSWTTLLCEPRWNPDPAVDQAAFCQCGAELGVDAQWLSAHSSGVKKWAATLGSYAPYRTGRYSRLAKLLIEAGMEPVKMASSSAFLLADDRIDQWLPADFPQQADDMSRLVAFLSDLPCQTEALTSSDLAESLSARLAAEG